MKPKQDQTPQRPDAERARVGLCVECVFARVIRTERSAFYQCRRAWQEAGFTKYPALPVRGCRGFARGAGAAPDEESHDG